MTGHEANFQGYVHRFSLAAGRDQVARAFRRHRTGERADPDSAGRQARPAAGTEVAAVRNVATSLTPRRRSVTSAPPAVHASQLGRATSPPACPGFDPNVCTDVVGLDPPVRPADEARHELALRRRRQDDRADAPTWRRARRPRPRSRAPTSTGSRRTTPASSASTAMTWVAEDAMDQARAADAARAPGEGALCSASRSRSRTSTTPRTCRRPTAARSSRASGRPRTRSRCQDARGRRGHPRQGDDGGVRELRLLLRLAPGARWNALSRPRARSAPRGGSAVATALSFTSFAMGSQTGDSLWGPSSAASLYSLRGTDGMQSQRARCR